MAPRPHDSEDSGSGPRPGGRVRFGLAAAARVAERAASIVAGSPLAGRWRQAWQRLAAALRTPRRRAIAALGLLVSIVVIVAFVAASPAAPPRAGVAAAGDGPPEAASGQPQRDGDGERIGDPSDDPTIVPVPGQGAGTGTAGPDGPPGGPPAGAAGPRTGNGTGGSAGSGSRSSKPRAAAPADPDAPRYTFPVPPAGSASYGRVHHTYPATDIFAACGTRVVAPTDGIVLEITRTDRWDPATDTGETRGGLSVTILGADGVRYYGSHLASIAAGLQVEDEVAAGQSLGTVGRTGSARGTSCHLHFGISPPCGIGDWAVRRGVVYPWPYLDSWRRGGHASPTDAVWSWRDAHPSACPMAG